MSDAELNDMDTLAVLLEESVNGDFNLFDPSVFEDEIALNTRWGAIRSMSGGTNFCSQRIKTTSERHVEFCASFAMKMVCMTLAILGVAFAVFCVVLAFRENAQLPLIGVVVGALVMIISLVVYFIYSCPIIFDKTVGYYWRGRQCQKEDSAKSFPLRQIHALQVIPHSGSHVESDMIDQTSYQMNLVLSSTQRVNITSHSNYEDLRDDAVVLSDFLSIPLWDIVALGEESPD